MIINATELAKRFIDIFDGLDLDDESTWAEAKQAAQTAADRIYEEFKSEVARAEDGYIRVNGVRCKLTDLGANEKGVITFKVSGDAGDFADAMKILNKSVIVSITQAYQQQQLPIEEEADGDEEDEEPEQPELPLDGEEDDTGVEPEVE